MLCEGGRTWHLSYQPNDLRKWFTLSSTDRYTDVALSYKHPSYSVFISRITKVMTNTQTQQKTKNKHCHHLQDPIAPGYTMTSHVQHSQSKIHLFLPSEYINLASCESFHEH